MFAPEWDKLGYGRIEIFTKPGVLCLGRHYDHRCNLGVSIAVRNIINHNNPGPIIGNVSSPLFGESNSLAGGFGPEGGGIGASSENADNRRMELQLGLRFEGEVAGWDLHVLASTAKPVFLQVDRHAEKTMNACFCGHLVLNCASPAAGAFRAKPGPGSEA